MNNQDQINLNFSRSLDSHSELLQQAIQTLETNYTLTAALTKLVQVLYRELGKANPNALDLIREEFKVMEDAARDSHEAKIARIGFGMISQPEQ
jgi:hypothetical protein